VQIVAGASTGDVTLRDVVESDLPIFFEHQQEEDAVTMAAFPPRDEKAFAAHWAKVVADESVFKKTIVFDGDVAGNIVSWERSGRRLVGYWIGKSYWGRGIATKALAEFLRHFEARPLYAHVAKQNRGSIRVLEKCGFSLYGETGSQDGVEEFIFEMRD
jgi:RimJ/RimL family protein N-acetyltransferase